MNFLFKTESGSSNPKWVVVFKLNSHPAKRYYIFSFVMALRKTNNSAELNPYDGSIEQIVNNNLGTGYEANTPNA